MSLILLPATNPDVYADPILLDDAKAQCRVFIDDDDALIADLIKAANDLFEATTGLSLITKSWELTLPWFCQRIYLQKSPLVSVTSIKYLDIDNVEQTLDPSVYQVNNKPMPGYVTLVPGQSWPALGTLENPVKIEFKAGYGDTPRDVPRGIRLAIKMLVAHWYATRETHTAETLSEVPMAYKTLFWANRVTVPV